MKKFLLATLVLMSSFSFADNTITAEAFCSDWANFPVSARLMYGNFMLNPILKVELNNNEAIVSLNNVRIGKLSSDWQTALFNRCGENLATSNAGGFFAIINFDSGWIQSTNHQESCQPNIIDGQQDGFIKVITDTETLTNAHLNLSISLGSVFNWAGNCQP